MNRFTSTFAAASLLALTACGAPSEDGGADDFASRIGSSTDAPAANGTVAPKIQEVKPGAAPGPFVPGTQTDPDSACAANKVGQFIGKLADDATRTQLQTAAVGAREIRFIAYGSSEFINPDPTNPRLNLMLDAQNIIRDARCG